MSSDDLTQTSLEEAYAKIAPDYILGQDKDGKYKLYPGPALIQRNQELMLRSVRHTLARLYAEDGP